MPITDEIRALILQHASSREIRKTAVAQGMKSLRQDGWRLIREGKSTPEEVLRLTKDEEATGALSGAEPEAV
jgi:general secretion pathway protein E